LSATEATQEEIMKFATMRGGILQSEATNTISYQAGAV
jgi:hypothetical protein